MAVCAAVAFVMSPGVSDGQGSRSATIQTDGVSSRSMDQKWIDESGADWVWPSGADGPNQYVQLVHTFDVPTSVADARLAISADTNYAVWLNGQFAGFGQWSNFPDDKTFDVLDLQPLVRLGPNRLCILAWYQGHDTSQYRKGYPGVLYAVGTAGKVAAVSGPATRMRKAPDYVSGPVPLVTGQLGFTFEHHGEKADGWLGGDYQFGASWTAPVPAETKPLAARPVRPRPVARLSPGRRIPVHVHAQGAFLRSGSSGTVAAAMQTDFLSWRSAPDLFERPAGTLPAPQEAGLTFKADGYSSATGPYVVLDLGREEAGLLEIEVDAPEGTVMDVAYGEHLEDLRVRAHVGGRNFAVRHVCGAGRHTFMHPFLRIAGRYIQVHIIPPAGAGAVVLYYAGMRPTDYPVVKNGAFRCPDAMHNRIWQVSERSLELCMHEHYEDCPWREQALYGMDGRNQMLAGYYCYGNYDFAAASLDLLAKGMNEEDGFLELCAPARVSVNIPSFSLAWIMALDDYLLFSGDRAFVRSQMPVARRILERCTRETSGALILNPSGRRMWHFYEWAPGLDKAAAGDLDAPLNLFYLLSLDAAARMTRECGENGEEFQRKAREVRAAVAPTFWDEGAHALRTRVGSADAPHFAELTQALALLADAVPADRADALRARLAQDNNGLVACTISHCLYRFEALLQDKDRYGARVFELIQRDWGMMIEQGATSFWETIDGAKAFGNAGSLCHGWSGIPAWFYGAWMLGVRPTAPGFAQYKIDPVPGVVTHAEGRVPTPFGVLEARWQLDAQSEQTTSSVTSVELPAGSAWR
jgi:alpha-L-rhamnosidase